MFSFPEKLNPFMVTLGVSIITLALFFISNSEAPIHTKLFIFIPTFLISMTLIFIGLPNWMRYEEMVLKLIENQLKREQAGLQIEIRSIIAEWDLDFDYRNVKDSEDYPEETNVTNYKIHVMVENKGLNDNTVKDFEVISKRYGNLNVSSPTLSKIAKRNTNFF
ncbi:hypothetical protein HYW20_07005 [Candidatus Woesearchaeota archaeon]|nr:hypothetical protein [Candidatus Woesearchaeota archaeon]